MFRRLDTTSNLESFSFRKGSKNKKNWRKRDKSKIIIRIHEKNSNN